MSVRGRRDQQLVVACLQTTGGGASKAVRIAQLLELGCDLPSLDLLVLPELWATGYFNFSKYEEDAEPIGKGDAQTALRRLAIEKAVWVVGGSIVERADDGALYNTTPVLSPEGDIVATYRKRHLFGHDSEERILLRPGTNSTSFDAAGVGVGLALCYDLRFPEAFEDYVADGCELYVVPATWPARRIDHWEKLIAARAIEGQAFCIGCNAGGEEGGVILGGRSTIVDPWGQCREQAGDAGQIVIATLDLAALVAYRETFTALTERRTTARDKAIGVVS